MNFGEHKFTRLSRVPASFLLNLWEQKSKKWKRGVCNHYDLLLYIEANLDKIKERTDKPISEIKLCSKIVFVTESEAKKEIDRISKIEQERKKPVRCYECDDCGYWHLTSKENIKYIKQ